MSFLFEKLEIYQKSLQLSNDIVKDTEHQKGFYFIVDQLRRASMSISLNIAEGNGRFNKKERRQFFLIARGSAFECIPLIEMCKSNKILSEEQVLQYRTRLDEICRMLAGLISGIENRRV